MHGALIKASDFRAPIIWDRDHSTRVCLQAHATPTYINMLQQVWAFFWTHPCLLSFRIHCFSKGVGHVDWGFDHNCFGWIGALFFLQSALFFLCILLHFVFFSLGGVEAMNRHGSTTMEANPQEHLNPKQLKLNKLHACSNHVVNPRDCNQIRNRFWTCQGELSECKRNKCMRTPPRAHTRTRTRSALFPAQPPKQ